LDYRKNVRPPRPSDHLRLKRFNEPFAIEVRCGSKEAPSSVRIPERIKRLGQSRPDPGRWQQVAQVRDMWKINDEWWRGREAEIERMYFELFLENGRVVTVFHDLIRDQWCQQNA